MKIPFVSVLLLSGSLLLPALAGAEILRAAPGSPTELTQGEVNNSSWKHTGDIALSLQQQTSEDVLDAVRKEVNRQGAQGYRVTRMQLMPNSSWSVNAAMYSPSVLRTTQEK